MAAARILSVEIDPASLPAPSPEVAHERHVAVAELVAEGAVGLPDPAAACRMRLSCQAARLMVEVTVDGDDAPVACHTVSLARLRRPLADYLAICRAHEEAASGARERLEAVDMARRALHDDGATLLQDHLGLPLDHPSARRLWTLVCALHLKG